MDGRRRGRVLFALVTTLLAVVSVIGQSAKAHTKRYLSTTTFEFIDNEGVQDTTDAFAGTVSSSKAACLSGRTVTVFREPNDMVGDPITTGVDGTWSLAEEDPGSAAYYVTVASRTIKRTASHKHVCKGVRSSSIAMNDLSEGIAPVVTNVTSPSSNGSYGAGATIPVEVVFSEPVIVTGTPTIFLATASPGSTAVDYTSGSGSDTLVFNMWSSPAIRAPTLTTFRRLR